MRLEFLADSRAAMKDIIDWILDRQSAVQQELDDLKKLHDQLRSQQRVLTGNLDRLRTDKDLMETELVSKFVEILNEKKKKIRSLRDELKKRPEPRSRADAETSDEDRAPKSPASKRKPTEQPALSNSLVMGTLSSAQSPPMASLDLLMDGAPDRAVVRPSIRKRHRVEDDGQTAADLQPLMTPPKRPKRAGSGLLSASPPHTNLAPPPAAAKLAIPYAQAEPTEPPRPARRGSQQKIPMIVDDKGSAPPLMKNRAALIATHSANPSPSYGSHRTAAPAATPGRASLRAAAGSAKPSRPTPRTRENAEDLFGEIE